jgi:hypothetical protein
MDDRVFSSIKKRPLGLTGKVDFDAELFEFIQSFYRVLIGA